MGDQIGLFRVALFAELAVVPNVLVILLHVFGKELSRYLPVATEPVALLPVQLYEVCLHLFVIGQLLELSRDALTLFAEILEQAIVFSFSSLSIHCLSKSRLSLRILLDQATALLSLDVMTQTGDRGHYSLALRTRVLLGC